VIAFLDIRNATHDERLATMPEEELIPSTDEGKVESAASTPSEPEKQ